MTTPAQPVVPETITVAIPTSTTIKMSTRDIAASIGKRHDHVMRDVKLLIEQGALRAPNFGETLFDVPMPNGAKPRKVPMYMLDFQGTMTLVTGYNAVLRSKVISRWMELEQQNAPEQPSLPPPTINPSEQNRLQQAIKAKFEGRANLAYAWSRFNNHFQLGSYKQLPSSKVEEALGYIASMPQPGQQPPAQQPELITEPGLYVFMFKDEKPLAVNLTASDQVWFRVRDLGRLLGYTNPTQGPLSRLTGQHATKKVTVTVDNKYTRETIFVDQGGLEWILTHTLSGEACDLSFWLCDKIAPMFGLRFSKLEGKCSGRSSNHLQLADGTTTTGKLALPVHAGATVPADSSLPQELARGGRFIAGIDRETGKLKLTELAADEIVIAADDIPKVLADPMNAVNRNAKDPFRDDKELLLDIALTAIMRARFGRHVTHKTLFDRKHGLIVQDDF